MDYGDLVTRAWSITWNNKFLWVLGFLAALTSIGSNSNSFQSSFDESNFANNPELAAQIGTMFLALVCVFMFIGLILWLLSVAARGGLIDGVNRIDDGEKVTLGDAFSAGTNAIWRLIGVYILAYLPLLIIGAIGGIATAIAVTSVGAMSILSQTSSDEAMAAVAGSMGLLLLCFCLLLCLMIPLGIVIFFIAEFAARATVIHKMGVTDSLSQGWRIFKENLGPIILLWLLIFVVSIIVGLALGVIMLPLSLVILAPMFASTFSSGGISGLNMVWMIGGTLCLGIVGAALMSVLQTWISAIWTLAYKEFTGKSPEPLFAEKVR
jgi:hypothetical protein